MRTLVISDIHGNIDALEALDAQMRANHEHFDDVWVLGDLVDYGAAPAEVIGWVRGRAAHVVRGNHDHAMGTGEDCWSAPRYHGLAVTTREYFRERLSRDDRDFLAGLPLTETVALPFGEDALLVHASPRNALFEYIRADAPDSTWVDALAPARCKVVLVGHTHDQFVRKVGRGA